MRSWLRIVLRELKTIFSDARVWLIMLFGPFFYGILFGVVYWNGRVCEVPTIIIDQDHSQFSRDLVSAINASESLRVTGYGNSVSDFEEAVKHGDAYTCVYIPSNFQRDLKKGHQGRVVVIIDGSNTLIGNVGYRALRTVFATYRLGVREKKLMASGIPKSAVQDNAMPIRAEIRPLFNPAYNYSTFLLMGLTCIALQQVTMLGAAISLGLESDYRRRRSLVEISRSPFQVMLGKLTAHVLITIPLALIAIRIPFSLFGTSFHGSWPLVLWVTALFVTVQILSGFGIAGLCRTSLLSAQVLLAVSVPLFILSGFTWPAMAMPAWVQKIGLLLPITHFANMVRKVSLMGASADMLWPEITWIAVWLPVSIIWAYWVIRRFMRLD